MFTLPSTQITVIVTDINDNRPEFVQSNFSITVSEGEDLSQDLIVVSATDNDADVNGEIQYILEGDQGLLYYQVPYSWKFSPGVKFCQFRQSIQAVKF